MWLIGCGSGGGWRKFTQAYLSFNTKPCQLDIESFNLPYFGFKTEHTKTSQRIIRDAVVFYMQQPSTVKRTTLNPGQLGLCYLHV